MKILKSLREMKLLQEAILMGVILVVLWTFLNLVGLVAWADQQTLSITLGFCAILISSLTAHEMIKKIHSN